jgi:uncharacterized protein YeaO (DUF488 family)
MEKAAARIGPPGLTGRLASWGGLVMPLKTRRWDDPMEVGDGFRVLICRYRPRALPKTKETWDVWYPDLGPSKDLHGKFYGKNGPPLPWDDYRRNYLEEMQSQGKRIARLAQLLTEGNTITLLCSSACTDAAHCHRTLLKQLIEAQLSAGEGNRPAEK